MLDKNLLYSLLGDRAGKTVVLDCVDSTNSYAKRIAASTDTVSVIAQRQSGGRGRLGRTFESPDGGLYMSFILRERIEVKKLPMLTAYVAVAVCRAIEAATGLDSAVKWVNDILIDGKKVCGILCESVFVGDVPKYTVIGVGVNCRNYAGASADGVKTPIAAEVSGLPSDLPVKPDGRIFSDGDGKTAGLCGKADENGKTTGKSPCRAENVARSVGVIGCENGAELCFDLSDGLSSSAVCIRGDRLTERLAAAITSALEGAARELECGEFIDEYRRRSCVIGRHVSVTEHTSGRVLFSGVAVGIDGECRLEVRPDGEFFPNGDGKTPSSCGKTDENGKVPSEPSGLKETLAGNGCTAENGGKTPSSCGNADGIISLSSGEVSVRLDGGKFR